MLKSPFKIIDWYIIKKFLGSYFFSIILILAITVVFDTNEKLDAFMKAPLHAIIFDYFANFLPYFANLFSPLFVFISVIFFTSKMADHSEIIAILSSGISFKRLFIPYMFAAAIIASLNFVLSCYVIPPSNIDRIEFTNTYVRNKRVEYGSDIQFKVSPNVVAYIARYDNSNKMGYRFSLEEFEGKTLRSRLTAQTITYDSGYHWHANNYVIRNLDGMNETITKGSRIDTLLSITPSDFLISPNDCETMTSPQLKEHIARQRERGVGNIKSFEIEYHKRYAMVAAAFILTAIGMSLSSRKTKAGMGINIGIGLALSFTYIFFSTITSTFAVSGATSPFIAMWIPNVVYTIIAIALYRTAPK